jgi:hypothetical protein
MGKPFYPARYFKRRFEYPLKHCDRCGARLLPRIRSQVKSGKRYEWLESFSAFNKRKTCGRLSDCRDISIGEVRFPLQPSNPSLGRIDEQTREMLAQALNNHPEMLEVWPEVVG